MLSYFDPSNGDDILNGVRSITDDAEREAMLKKLNRTTYDEYWALPIVWAHDTYALSPQLVGWSPTNGTTSDLHFETISAAP